MWKTLLGSLMVALSVDWLTDVALTIAAPPTLLWLWRQTGSHLGMALIIALTEHGAGVAGGFAGGLWAGWVNRTSHSVWLATCCAGIVAAARYGVRHVGRAGGPFVLADAGVLAGLALAMLVGVWAGRRMFRQAPSAATRTAVPVLGAASVLLMFLATGQARLLAARRAVAEVEVPTYPGSRLVRTDYIGSARSTLLSAAAQAAPAAIEAYYARALADKGWRRAADAKCGAESNPLIIEQACWDRAQDRVVVLLQVLQPQPAWGGTIGVRLVVASSDESRDRR